MALFTFWCIVCADFHISLRMGFLEEQLLLVCHGPCLACGPLNKIPTSGFSYHTPA